MDKHGSYFFGGQILISNVPFRSALSNNDEVHFIRSWMAKPLVTGAVMPSGRPLARAMAKFVDPNVPGQVIELGPGTGAVTAALVERGIEPSRMVLVEFNPTFCRLLRTRYPEATILQGDAYGLKRLLSTLLCDPAAAVVSGLPLVTKHLKIRLRLLTDAFALLTPGAPFVQITYALASPIPHSFSRAHAHGSKLIWFNLPPARVWVYRQAQLA
jgi:phosphatidylethanolamine/phosphatidyl-N-methylethanolamine N-methyltransferase